MTTFNDNRNSIYRGAKLTVEIYGASHADKIGVNIDGFKKGDSYSPDLLQEFLNRRKAVNTAYSTKRFEPDICEVLSGATDGVFTGDKFSAIIKNTNVKSADYGNLVKIPRPSHADFVAWSKYGDGFDYRGGGKFSGRMTAATCIAGGICKQLLEKQGIKITAYVSQIGDKKGCSYKSGKIPTDNGLTAEMLSEIEKTQTDGDSIGGKIECVITGVPVGIGEFMFDSIEGVISKLAFSVPAVKGIEFGTGFDLANMLGSVANDAFYYDNGVVKTKTNHNGGINGGLSNGMPITFGVVIKPTPSISKPQQSVDLVQKQNTPLTIKGRHDACIVPRAVPVIEAISAIAIYDLLNG
jgi:chorismate synthase